MADLNTQVREVTPPALFRGPTLILGPKGCFLFANAVEYADANAKGSTNEVGAGSTDYEPPVRDRDEYVMWGFSALHASGSFRRHREGIYQIHLSRHELSSTA